MSIERFNEYLNKIKDFKDDRCWFCGKTVDEIRAEYFEYMKHPAEGFEDVDLDDLLIMTYKTHKPVCAGCYFAIKRNPDLVKEILERPPDDIWGP